MVQKGAEDEVQLPGPQQGGGGLQADPAGLLPHGP